MILFCNVKITNSRMTVMHRGNLSSPDRMDVFKYALASYVPLLPLISKAVFYIDLATTEYAGKEPELEEYIRSLYPKDKLILNWFRLVTGEQWRKSYLEDVEPFDDDIVFNVTNDDHIFIDKDISIFKKCLEHLKNCSDPYASFCYSHYPEVIRMGANAGFIPNEDLSSIKGNLNLIVSFDCVKKERWRHYWFDFDHTGISVFRTEGFGLRGAVPFQHELVIPLREQIRHFDGYQHAGNFFNIVPPLEIPLGFFENQIKIAYGYDHNKDGYVNINPAATNFKVEDINGVDYKFALEEIPVFWKEKISQIDINPNANIEELKKNANKFLYDKACLSIINHGPITPYPIDLFKN